MGQRTDLLLVRCRGLRIREVWPVGSYWSAGPGTVHAVAGALYDSWNRRATQGDSDGAS